MARLANIHSVLLLLLCNIVYAARITLQIHPSNILTNPNSLPPSTHATLTAPNGVVLRAPIRKDNNILIEDIQTVGSHLLSIYTRDYVFASYRIDTTPDLTSTGSGSEGQSSVLINFAAQLFPGTQWSDTGVNLVPSQPDASSPSGQSARPQTSITIAPRIVSQKEFYETRAGFSPLSLLKNPMILLAIVALAFTFGMPKLMENMDPETRAEYEEMQKKGPTAAIGRAMNGQGPASSSTGNFDLAGYLAGQKQEASKK